MHRFIVTYQASVDGRLEVGQIGSVGMTDDYQHDLIIQTIIEQLMKNYPRSKDIVVKILEVKKVKVDEYNKAIKDFLRLTN